MGYKYAFFLLAFVVCSFSANGQFNEHNHTLGVNVTGDADHGLGYTLRFGKKLGIGRGNLSLNSNLEDFFTIRAGYEMLSLMFSNNLLLLVAGGDLVYLNSERLGQSLDKDFSQVSVEFPLELRLFVSSRLKLFTTISYRVPLASNLAGMDDRSFRNQSLGIKVGF